MSEKGKSKPSPKSQPAPKPRVRQREDYSSQKTRITESKGTGPRSPLRKK